jgi:hypothetical protein
MTEEQAQSLAGETIFRSVAGRVTRDRIVRAGKNEYRSRHLEPTWYAYTESGDAISEFDECQFGFYRDFQAAYDQAHEYLLNAHRFAYNERVRINKELYEIGAALRALEQASLDNSVVGA